MKKFTHIAHIILIVAAVLCGVFGLFMMLGMLMGYPIPRGSKVDKRYYTYYQNYKGIYYISLENAFFLYNHGHWGYLEDVDKDSFKVLSSSWAMDKNHVWHYENIVEEADAATFRINESGLPVDRYNVYVWNEGYDWVPSKSGIDPATAEYFIPQEDHSYQDWLRDKDNVYYKDKKVDVDRNTFSKFATDYYVDKDFLYGTQFNESLPEKWELIRIDSLRNPLLKANKWSPYMRNGRNIIYHNKIILKDIDVHRFEMGSPTKCVVNDMVLYEGKPFLKDTLNVAKAKFYGYDIITDGENVFWGHQRLDDIDAATFKEIEDDTFEDKDYVYTIKDFTRRTNDNYPFNKRRKLLKGEQGEQDEQNEEGEQTLGLPLRLLLVLFFGVSGLRILRI